MGAFKFLNGIIQMILKRSNKWNHMCVLLPICNTLWNDMSSHNNIQVYYFSN